MSQSRLTDPQFGWMKMKFLFLIANLLILSVTIAAQGIRVSGTAGAIGEDSEGHAIRDTTVTVTSADQAYNVTVKADDQGKFSVLLPTKGLYIFRANTTAAKLDPMPEFQYIAKAVKDLVLGMRDPADETLTFTTWKLPVPIRLRDNPSFLWLRFFSNGSAKLARVYKNGDYQRLPCFIPYMGVVERFDESLTVSDREGFSYKAANGKFSFHFRDFKIHMQGTYDQDRLNFKWEWFGPGLRPNLIKDVNWVGEKLPTSYGIWPCVDKYGDSPFISLGK
jgi:hypothetical protein